MKKKDIVCPHCRSLNPPSAYVCVKCFKVIYEKYKVPFWKIQVSSMASTVIISIAAFVAVVMVLNKWLASVEAEMSIKVATSEYNVSVAAEKARRKLRIKISTPSAETTELGLNNN